VQTLGCGIERITGVKTDEPKSQLVYTSPVTGAVFPHCWAYLIQSVPSTYSLIVLDIANGAKPVEVFTAESQRYPQTTLDGMDAKTQRVVVTGKESRLFLVKLDPATGVLSMDDAFHDEEGKPGFNFADRPWTHGWKGPACHTE